MRPQCRRRPRQRSGPPVEGHEWRAIAVGRRGDRFFSGGWMVLAALGAGGLGLLAAGLDNCGSLAIVEQLGLGLTA